MNEQGRQRHEGKSLLGYFFLCFSMMAACVPTEESPHYFLDGYDHLEFRDTLGRAVPASQYIDAVYMNSARAYQIRDTSLILYDIWAEEPYTGFIRTFHKGLYNLQGEFRDGKMFRLRYWYSDRTLGMDANYEKETGSVWNQNGNLVVNWNVDEMYYLSPLTQTVRRVISDTLTSYYNSEGELTSYTIRRDTAFISYYEDGTPRFKFPISRTGERQGVVKRWYPNGQLKVIGRYNKGEETGTWIEYDSLGNETGRKFFGDN